MQLDWFTTSTPTLALGALIGVLGVVYYFLNVMSHPEGSGHAHIGKELPCPLGYPVVGNLLQIDTKRAHRTFTAWAKQHGPLFGLKLGSFRGLVISDPALIREAFNNPVFSGRPDNRVLTLFSGGGKHGILSADGAAWAEQRRFTLRQLRTFSFGKSSMEALLMREVTELVDGFQAQALVGAGVCPNRRFSLAVLNGLWMIVTGQRYRHDDPSLTKILEDLFKTIDKVFSSGALMFFPKLATLFPNLSGWNSIAKAAEEIQAPFQKLVREHEATRVEGDPRDFIDAYLDEIGRTTDPGSSFHEKGGAYKNLVAVIFDMFAAGSETTSNILTWLVLYVAYFPEIQTKLQEEIDAVVGANRPPFLTDKPHMPYTDALISEVYRYSETVVLGLFHTTTEPTVFHGYFVPQGTYVSSNFYWCHRDPAIWGDPQNFRPERFLEGNVTVQQREALMPFSVGRRLCIGETLARDQLFLFVVSIFQRFDMELLEVYKRMGTALLEPMPGFMNVAQKFEVQLRDRLD